MFRPRHIEKYWLTKHVQSAREPISLHCRRNDSGVPRPLLSIRPGSGCCAPNLPTFRNLRDTLSLGPHRPSPPNSVFGSKSDQTATCTPTPPIFLLHSPSLRILHAWLARTPPHHRKTHVTPAPIPQIQITAT